MSPHTARTSGLGRLVQHDPRSVHYALPVHPRSAIKSVDWTRRAPIFDQGSLGSCTGNAAAGLVGTDAQGYQGQTSVSISGNALTVDETLATQLYSLATQLDDVPGAYPPDDTGSSGLGAAKALVKLGLSTVYQHAFSMDALDTALQRGPVMIGVDWYNSMFEPSRQGVITVDRRSGLAGGHEFVVSGYDGVMYRMDNSWGTSWGANGSGFFRRVDLAVLLAAEGDVTQPTFVTAPAPDPTPVPVPPVGLSDAELWHAVQNWAAAKGFTAV